MTVKQMLAKRGNYVVHTRNSRYSVEVEVPAKGKAYAQARVRKLGSSYSDKNVPPEYCTSGDTLGYGDGIRCVPKHPCIGNFGLQTSPVVRVVAL